ncbi:hypothetical protein KFL_000240190 [Klebsormidium nitens]|uniref:Uncharacterized protein n=1 Tax=Klebsormidium nitens TaxID=105231 RepID=A0A1Y1HTC9_KLENI|nr:hypothetical protein KFL_000240190 [Klebsormidium nitens]|eukprot:GAQ79088.1 hypothetical protein KFL_000240190 [Klebsormidium nitens]
MAGESRHFSTSLLNRYASATLDEAAQRAFTKHACALIDRIISETWIEPRGAAGRVRDPYVYTGSGGTAFLLLKLTLAATHPNNLETCMEIVEECAKVAGMMREHPSFLLGQPGVYALGAVAAFHAGKRDAQNVYLRMFLQAGHMPNLATPSLQCNSDPPNELLYGRAGFLWSALFLNTHLGQGIIPESVTQPIVSTILADGRACARGSQWPLMYEWHGKRYLGAAHGVAGVMHILLHFPLSDTDLSDWCHGAAGVALTLCTAARRFRNDEDGKVFLQAATEAGEVVWQRGLLRKVGLCHGVAGNAYVFLALYKLTGDAKHLQRAHAFGRFRSEEADALIEAGEMHGGDRQWSLFEGLAGTPCLYLDLTNPQNAKFPGYDSV